MKHAKSWFVSLFLQKSIFLVWLNVTVKNRNIVKFAFFVSIYLFHFLNEWQICQLRWAVKHFSDCQIPHKSHQAFIQNSVFHPMAETLQILVKLWFGVFQMKRIVKIHYLMYKNTANAISVLCICRSQVLFSF